MMSCLSRRTSGEPKGSCRQGRQMSMEKDKGRLFGDVGTPRGRPGLVTGRLLAPGDDYFDSIR